MQRKSIFKGAATALITPIKRGKIDLDSLERLIDMQLSEGIDALVLSGTTGESATVSEKELEEMVRLARRQINGRIPLIAGTGSNDTEKAVRLSKTAANAGCDALLVVTPYYNKATPKGLYLSYKRISESTDLPVILYNVPSRSGLNVPREAYERIAELSRVVAVKEASGDLIGISSFLSEFGDRFDLYSGTDEIAVPTMSIGGAGLISVVSNVIPHDISRMCRLCRDGLFDEARRLQLKYTPLIKAVMSEVNPIPIKYAAHLMGLCEAEYRLPLCEPSQRTAELLRLRLAELGLI